MEDTKILVIYKEDVMKNPKVYFLVDNKSKYILKK